MTRIRRLLSGRRWSSRQRLSVQIVGAVVVIWAVIGLTSVLAVQRAVYDDIDDDLVSEAHDATAALQILTSDELGSIRLETPGARDSAVVVLGAGGVEAFVPTGTAANPDPMPDVGADLGKLRAGSGRPFTTGAVEGEVEYRAIAAPLDDGRVLVIARPLDDVTRVIRAVERITLIGFLTTIAAALLLVWLISRHALRPLEDVIATAGEIGDETITRRVEVTTDAPDVVRLADALNVMLQRLEDAFDQRARTEDRLRQFVADASHELRTPLAGILGYAELYQELEAASAPQEQQDRAVERIAVEADRMRSLVESLLTLARLDDGRDIHFAPVPLGDVAHDAVAVAGTIDAERTYVTDLDPTVIVEGDAQALRQIVDNLVANVRAHTPVGTTARVTVLRDGPDAVLEVADDGPGLTDEQAAHAFDRFWRAESHRGRPGGSGLGLAIVADLVHAHHGSVQVAPRSGSGLRVVVRLGPGPGGARPAPPSWRPRR